MNPRAYLIRSHVPPVSLSREAEDLGLYAAAAERSWAHFPLMARVDGLSMDQLKGLREKARVLDIAVAETMPCRQGQGWCEGLALTADTVTLASLARNVSLDAGPVGRAIEEMLDALGARTRRLHLKTGELHLPGEAGAVLMGVLNVTPDSFSDGGKFLEPDAAVDHASEMARSGARIIDVGGESSRPGASPVSIDEEMSRTVPVIEKLRLTLPPTVHISIDTMKAEVARAAVQAGAEIINDVSGMAADPSMRTVAAELGVHVIINHMRGTPRTMQEAPSYRHVIPEVVADLSDLMEAAVREGIERERIILDPGIGFGKRLSDNMAILRHLAAFVSLGRPVAVGVSRKSFLAAMAPGIAGESIGAAGLARADATMVAEAIAVLGGAHIIRTHDPARAALSARIAQAVSARALSSPSD